MRYGLFSDVHGNLEALAVVLEGLKALKVDSLMFLGDAVGYGANPDEACTMIRACADLSVLGNHDAAVSGRMPYAEYYDAARNAIDWCVARVSPENQAWLRSANYKERRDFVELCHGAPMVPEDFEYLFTADQVGELLEDDTALAPVTFVGHSHLTTSFRLHDDSIGAFVGNEIRCDPDAKFIITVGSVGQPRDRDPRACCGVFDTETRVFTYHRFEYDVHRARKKILDAGLSQVFGDRLLVGV